MDKKVPMEAIEPIIIDAGLVYKNWGENNEAMIGVTRGGNSFQVEPEYKDIERDGARGKEKHMKRLINLDANLVVNLMTLTIDNLKDALGVGELVTSGEPETTVLKSSLDIDETDYIDNITLIGEKLGGGYIRITIFNAFSDQGIEIAMEDREETVVEVTFAAHFDPEASESTDYSDLFEIEHLATLPE